MVAYSCAISRSYPIYDQKTKSKPSQRVDVGFILVGPSPYSQEDVKCLNALSGGVRLAQKIVDLPCNFMHTDGFLEVRECISCVRVGGAHPTILLTYYLSGSENDFVFQPPLYCSRVCSVPYTFKDYHVGGEVGSTGRSYLTII